MKHELACERYEEIFYTFDPDPVTPPAMPAVCTPGTPNLAMLNPVLDSEYAASYTPIVSGSMSMTERPGML